MAEPRYPTTSLDGLRSAAAQVDAARRHRDDLIAEARLCSYPLSVIADAAGVPVSAVKRLLGLP